MSSMAAHKTSKLPSTVKIPFSTSKSQVEILQNSGFNIAFKSYPKVHTIAEDELGMIKAWLKRK